MATFNILHGFTEALVRGMRSSFLTDADYHHLTQCETLDDVKLNLSESDYGDALADMGTLIPTGLQKAAVEKVSFNQGGGAPVCFWHVWIVRRCN
jgi:V-type H+-transporting ATPase subunit d